MAITKTTTPYEFLARWKDGALAGAHVKFLETITDNGVVVSQREGDPKAVAVAGASGFPLEDILTTLQAQAITERDAAIAAKSTAETALATAANAHELETTTNTAALVAKDATIASLQAQIEALTPATPTTDPLGPVVSDLQIRLAMNQVGLRKAVESAVAASTDPSLKDWYARAQNFKRHDPMVLGMIHSLGVSDVDADSLFALAASLQG